METAYCWPLIWEVRYVLRTCISPWKGHEEGVNSHLKALSGVESDSAGKSSSCSCRKDLSSIPRNHVPAHSYQ